MIQLHISSFNMPKIITILLTFLAVPLSIIDPVWGQSSSWERPRHKNPDDRPLVITERGISLLSGRVESHGTSEERCLLMRGVLKMEIKTRTGDYAMCCVNLNEPVEVSAGDKISAIVDLKESEDKFHVKVEAKDGQQQIYLNKESLDKGESPLELTLNREDLIGRESIKISKFCIAAIGDGKLQKVEVRKAIFLKRLNR